MIFDMFLAEASEAAVGVEDQGLLRGSDIRYNLTISFEEAAFGRQKKLR